MKGTSSILALAPAVIFAIAYVTLSAVSGTIVAGLLLGCAVFPLAMLLARDNSARLVVCAFAAFFCSATLAYFAVSSEITGKAVHYRPNGRTIVAEPVTRSGSPAQFRHAVNFKWGLSLLSAAIAAGTFMFLRKVETSDPFHAGDNEGSSDLRPPSSDL
jgi:hypothetical protein